LSPDRPGSPPSPAASRAAEATAVPSPAGGKYPVYVLGVLLLAYILNFVDRQMLALAAVDVRDELGLSNTEMGILLGPVFVLFYTIAGVPLARLADATSRTAVLGLGLTLWSAMTAACGAAGSFLQLSLARFGVGIGEATGTPTSHSLISDYFPPERRSTALGVYGWGIFVGTGFGFIVGGMLLESWGWRSAFYLAGLAGLPVALLIFLTVREPTAGVSEGQADTGEGVSLVGTLRTLAGIPSFRTLMIAASCQAFLGYTILSWGVTFLREAFDLSGAEAGLRFGLFASIAGAIGVTLGGTLADRLTARDPRGPMTMSAISSAAALPFGLAFAWAGDVDFSMWAFAPFYLLNSMYVSSLWTVVQNLVRPRMRATASATQLGILNIAGLGFGPLMAGIVIDVLEPSWGGDALRVAFTIAAVVGASAAFFFLRCARTLRADLARVAAEAAQRGG
ncbi:MAG: MFS transporter, partial [Myxococcales bacterium]|nr:MFS transporter [Myxococcales bacterium]